jgi:uncharacterized protein YgiM (DUF1202 family)
MQRLKWIVLSTLVALALVLFSAVVYAQSSDALVRFVHVIPGAQAIDIYVDGQLTITGLDYGQATDFLTVAAETHTVVVTQSGLTTTLWQQDVVLPSDTASTMVASSVSQLIFSIYTDSLTPLDLGKARLTVIHAMADGPSVDALIAGSRAVFPDLVYNTPTGSIDLDLSVEYTMAVVPAEEDIDNAIIPEEVLPLTSGSLYTYVIYGTSSAPEKLLLAAPTTPNADSAFIRVAHVIPGGPEVDIFFNDVRVASRVSYGATTQYIPVAVGTYDIGIKVSESGDDLAGANLSLDAGNIFTIVAAGTLETPAIAGAEDNFSDLDAETSVITVINALPNSQGANVSLADGTELVSDLEFLDTGSASFEPSDEAATVSVDVDGEALTIDLPEMPFYAGVYYSVVLIAGEEEAEAIVLDPVSVAQGVGSAPGDETIGGEVAQAPTATPVPTEAAPTEAAQETPVTAQPVTSGSTIVSATVVGLDPTANLRLRQYPNTGSTTLHLIPVGTALIVNGREGPELFPESLPTPTLAPEATAFVDPATLLTGGDLDPATTWLNVTYNTPDGGTITAWTVASFLEVRDGDGESQRLADLPLIPRNRAGEAVNTSITPPPNNQDRVTVTVVGIEPTAHLNLRRTPDTNGEVLAPLPATAVMDFLGINQDRTWVFIRYISQDGITYTGWVSIGFVQLNLNDQPTNFSVLESRHLLVITPIETRGTSETGAPPVVAATRDPLRNVTVGEVTGVNADANLNLRRTPNVQAEVLSPVPGGSILIVVGRTEDATWLEATYEGQTGWVSSQYVTLTFNGVGVDINTIPVTSLRLTSTPSGAATATPGA